MREICFLQIENLLWILAPFISCKID
jgi:hypothetical protein